MSHQKKILHFHPNGKFAQSFVKPLMDAEIGAGYISSIVTSSNGVAIGATEIHYDLSIRNLFFLPCVLIQTYIILRRYAPDIVISHNSKSSFLVLACAWLARVPVRIYFNHGVSYLGYGGLIKFTLLFLEKANLMLSTKAFTVSLDMLYALRKIDSIKSISIVNNGSASGIDLSLYGKERYPHSTFRLDNNIADEDFLLIFIGRPEKRKGFNLLLDLWVQNFTDIKYKLVLCGPYERDVVNALGFLPNNILPLGFTNQIPEILSQSDLLILPSFHEGLPYSILEAMASCCLVLANDIPGIRNLIIDKFHGFLINNNDINKYVEMIRLIQSSPEDNLDSIRKIAFDSVKKYSRDSFLTSYILHLH
jgi:glycosyltransferase involved in cell wall biosynthesis